jgi:hypothetical protein
MKKLILSMAVVAMLFSCSKDNVTSETETTADLTQMLPTKALDQSTEGLYVGVFGHNEIKELHGKILINAGNDGKYSAIIEMVNGNDIKFQGSSINKTNIHFTSDRGSFDFNTVDFTSPTASNVTVDNIADAYIVTVKAQNRMIPHVLLGTYEESGNETNFFGNWDMIGDDEENPNFCCNAQGLGQLVITHLGTVGPFVVTSFLPTLADNGCMGEGWLPHLFDTSGDGVADAVFMADQTNTISGTSTDYFVNIWAGGVYADRTCGDIGGPTSGTWSRGTHSGLVYGIVPAPFTGPSNSEPNFPFAASN